MKKQEEFPKEFGAIPNEYYAIEKPKLQISEAIKEAMDDSGLSLRTLAAKIPNLSYTQIARITSGKNYTIGTLLKVLDELGLEIVIREKEVKRRRIKVKWKSSTEMKVKISFGGKLQKKKRIF